MKVSEQFYSVQGEGPTQGTPAYFIRLKGCNLMCGGSNGALVNLGKATWHCDTEDVWRNGQDFTNQEVFQEIKETGKLKDILEGSSHLIWTGGEPTLPRHREDILKFLGDLDEQFGSNRAYNEVETNGTLVLPYEFMTHIQQFNVSPKLSNSGIPKAKRIIPEAIHRIKEHDNYSFKFVVDSPSDADEIERDFVRPCGVRKDKILIMPAGSTRTVFEKNLFPCSKICMNQGYKLSQRLQIKRWDRATGI